MHNHGIDEEDIEQHPDLEALLEHLGRVELKPAFLKDRLQEVIQELSRRRIQLEVIEDEVKRMPEGRGRVNLLQTLDLVLHGVPRRALPPAPTAGTVATWEANIRFEMARWDQLPLEEATAALDRLEQYAGELSVEATERGVQLRLF